MPDDSANELDDYIIFVNPDRTEWGVTSIENWELCDRLRLDVDGNPMIIVEQLNNTTWLEAKKVYELLQYELLQSS